MYSEPQAVVPEPGAATLLLLGICAAAARRSRVTKEQCILN
jgi:hypothetical protein